jgi:O-antigen biosynthesis protein WbqP
MSNRGKLYDRIKRPADLAMAVLLALLLVWPTVVLIIIIRCTSAGPVLYWSDRVGKNNKIFKMPKLRSMRIDTPVVASHLLNDPHSYLTPIGRFLRVTSLDELPQLWCIIRGEMSFVGPRPALFNQSDLIQLRTDYGIQILLPGLTGWAQINGRDELGTVEKVAFDFAYLERRSLSFDAKILVKTLFKVISRDSVIH